MNETVSRLLDAYRAEFTEKLREAARDFFRES